MKSRYRWLAVVGGVVLVAVVAFATRDRWPEWLTALKRQFKIGEPSTTAHDDHHDHHDGAGAASAGDGATLSVKLSDQARANLQLELGKITLTDHWRMLSVPGTVNEEPGHCEQGISATVQGVILRIHAFLGQTVRPGDPLFDVQLTSELMATAQSALLKTLQEREVVDQEIKRLSPAVESGTIMRSRLIEKEYELKRLDALRQAQSQELLVRGLSAEQINQIITSKTLLRELTITVPTPQPGKLNDGAAGTTIEAGGKQPAPNETGIIKTGADDHANEPESKPKTRSQHSHGITFTVEELNIRLGKFIQPGDELMHLARHEQLLIEGKAFESDTSVIQQVLAEGWPVTACFSRGDAVLVERTGLSILYVDNTIDDKSRSLRFFVPIQNEILRDNPGPNGLLYRTWRFKPGQSVSLQLPRERLPKRIVLPADAVVREGADAFAFRANGKLLERVPVVVETLDSRTAVIRNDGSLVPGFDVVAMNRAYELNLELKKVQSGGGDGGHHHHHDHEH